MYIRRKVFSVGLDEAGEERLFSTNEFINDERLFSAEGEELVEVVDENGMKKYVPAALLAAGGAGLGAGAGLYGDRALNYVGDKMAGFKGEKGISKWVKGHAPTVQGWGESLGKVTKTKKGLVGAGIGAATGLGAYGAYKGVKHLRNRGE